LINTSLTSL